MYKVDDILKIDNQKFKVLCNIGFSYNVYYLFWIKGNANNNISLSYHEIEKQIHCLFNYEDMPSLVKDLKSKYPYIESYENWLTDCPNFRSLEALNEFIECLKVTNLITKIRILN